MQYINEYSYGAIPLLRQGWTYKILLVQHARGHRGLPKGHAQKKKDGTMETPLEAAVRELYEETGILNAHFDTRHAFTGSYRYSRQNFVVDKEVAYFPAWVSTEIVYIPKEFRHEIIACHWYTLDHAAAVLKHQDYQRLIGEIKKYIARYAPKQLHTA